MQGRRPHEVKEFTFKDRKMWKDCDRSSVGHFLHRATYFAQQVQEVENIRTQPKHSKEGRNSGARKQEDRKRVRDRNQKKHYSTPWTKPWLLPRCYGIRKIEDCGEASKNEKEVILAKIFRRGGKRQNRNMKATVGVDGSK